MALFCLLLLTAFLQPPWAVAPTNGNGGPEKIFIGGVPVFIVPKAGQGGDNSVGFSGIDTRTYDTRSESTFSHNQGGFTFGPTQTNTPAYGDPGQEYEEPNHSLDAEYEEAKDDLERAEAFAAQMTARCNQRFIQNNYILRTKCYAERDQAIAARDAAKEIFEAVKARVESAAQAETTTENLGQEPDHSLDHEYEEAKDDLERAEAFAAQMTARCNQWNIQRNYNLRTQCYAERDQAIAARDAAKEKFEAVKARVESAAHAGTTTSENLSPSEKLDSALQNLHTALNKLNGVNNAPTSTFDSYTSDIINKNIGAINFNQMEEIYNLKLQVRTENGICVEHWEIGLTRLADKMFEPTFDVKCKDSSGMRNRINRGNTLLVSNPDDSFCFFSNDPKFLTVIKDGACTKYIYNSNGVKTMSIGLNAKDCDQEKKTMWDLIKAEEGGASISTFNDNEGITEDTSNTGISLGDQNKGQLSGPIDNNQLSADVIRDAINFNDFGKTYKLKLQIKLVDGICMEHWEIGLTRLGDKMFEPTFDVKCKDSSGMINRKNGPNALLVSSPHYKFCFFSNNPSFLTVIIDGTCTKYQYDNNGDKKSADVLGAKDCDQEKQTMWDLIKSEYGGAVPNTYNKNENTPDGPSETGTMNFNDLGKTYKMKIQMKTVDGVCMEHWEIGLTRLADKMWEPAFDVKCKDTSGLIHRKNGPNTLLVSNPDHNFCFFSNNPNSLTVIKDGTCTKYQYDNNGVKKSARELGTRDCDKEKKTMWDLIKAEREGASTITDNATPGGTSNTEPPVPTVPFKNPATQTTPAGTSPNSNPKPPAPPASGTTSTSFLQRIVSMIPQKYRKIPFMS